MQKYDITFNAFIDRLRLAETSGVPLLKQELSSWLSSRGASAENVVRFLLICVEAGSNTSHLRDLIRLKFAFYAPHNCLLELPFSVLVRTVPVNETVGPSVLFEIFVKCTDKFGKSASVLS
jgi:hypothetical protein